MNFFHKKNSTTTESLRLARIELTWIFHNVRHNHSFRSMDCTSKLLKKFYDPKLSCARTKTEAVVTNVLRKWVDETISQEINACSVVVVASDASNHNATKLLPVVLRSVFSFCVLLVLK